MPNIEEINLVPTEILYILPSFDGNEALLDSFVTKCDYVVKHFRGKGSEAQDLYLLHCITSKLTGKAAVFASSKTEICKWEQLKELLFQRFGDLRSEECVASELASLQIEKDESFIDFYHRLLAVKNKVLSKISPDLQPDLKRSKELVYEKMALNSLIFNLPEDYARLVRFKGANTVEDILKLVIEQDSFNIEYENRKRNNSQKSRFGYRPNFENEKNYNNGLHSVPFGGFASSQPNWTRGSKFVSASAGHHSESPAFGSTGNAGLFGASSVTVVPASSAPPQTDNSHSFGANLPDNPPKIFFNNETNTFQNNSEP